MNKNLKNDEDWGELWVLSRNLGIGYCEDFDGVWFDKYNQPYKFRERSYGKYYQEGYWYGLLNRKFEE